MTNEQQILWLAGLLEGEGCFSTGFKNKSMVLQLEMTDEDVVKRAASIMRTSYHLGKRNKISPRYKDVYRIRIYGEKACSIMRQILPFMGHRRSLRIEECLNDQATRETKLEKSERMKRFNMRRKRCKQTKDLFVIEAA